MRASRNTGRLAARNIARSLWLGAPLLLVACASGPPKDSAGKPIDPVIVQMYAAPKEEPFKVPPVNVAKVEPQYLRQIVPLPPELPPEAPGTIIVDPQNRFLYLVQGDGSAMRYGIGVGREGFAWTGAATIGDKSPWPRWNPTPEHQARDPKAAKYPKGMDGGLQNPIGARALYLWQNNKDTLFRIHGTSEPESIGKAVSSGCIRLFNQDIIDLYERVEIGTKVVVLTSPDAPEYIDGVPVAAPLAPPAETSPI